MSDLISCVAGPENLKIQVVCCATLQLTFRLMQVTFRDKYCV